MKYHKPGNLHVEDESPSCCLSQAETMWAQDDVLMAAQDERPIPTDAIDHLPPWRAVLTVGVAVAAGAQMQHGDIELLRAAAAAVGGSAPAGWWRAALDLPAIVDAPILTV